MCRKNTICFNKNVNKINYVVAGWTGPRRTDSDAGYYYLEKHIETLYSLKHNLDQITIVVPQCGYSIDFINNLRQIKSIQNSPVVFFERENLGLSYGGWSDVYSSYENLFDYYILMEDDYVFVEDNFDIIMKDLIEKHDRCGYLCAYVEKESYFIPRRSRKSRINRNRKILEHASSSNGIIRSRAADDVVKLYGKLPYDSVIGYNNCYSQIKFSHAFIEAGWELRDFCELYNSPYFCETSLKVLDFSPNHEKYLIKPIQMIYPKNT